LKHQSITLSSLNNTKGIYYFFQFDRINQIMFIPIILNIGNRIIKMFRIPLESCKNNIVIKN